MTKKTTSKSKKKTAATSKDAAVDPPVDEKAEADKASEPKPEDMPKAERVSVDTKAPSPEPPRRASTGFVGWLALVLALGALTGTAYLVFENWRAGSSDQESDAAITDLDNTLNATRDSLASLEQRLDSLAGRDVASVGELQSMERRLNETFAGSRIIAWASRQSRGLCRISAGHIDRGARHLATGGGRVLHADR